MELKQLRAFVAVGEMGGFSKASRMLFISQPTLSYQISSLEEEIGAKLFVRENNKIYLTPMGREMMEPVKKILGEVDNIKFRMSHPEDASGENTLKVGFSRVPLHENFITATNMLESFSKKNGVRIVYNRMSIEKCIEGVREGPLDIAFINMREYDKLPTPFIYHAVSKDRFILIHSRKYGEVDFRTAVEDFRFIKVEQMESRDQDYKYVLSGLKVKPKYCSASNLEEAFDILEEEKCMMIWQLSDYEKYLSRSHSRVDIPGDHCLLYYGALWNAGNRNKALFDFAGDLEL